MLNKSSIHSIHLSGIVFFTAVILALNVTTVLAANEDCLTCHANMAYGEPKGDTPRIHDASGNFLHEPHGALACTDCHTDITEVPHRQGVERTVQCETCHN